MPHLPYLSHLAPNDFYLFSTVKEKLERIQRADQDQFFESLQTILRNIDQDESSKIFHAWVQRILNSFFISRVNVLDFLHVMKD
jgi:hypothetical protein